MANSNQALQKLGLITKYVEETKTILRRCEFEEHVNQLEDISRRIVNITQALKQNEEPNECILPKAQDGKYRDAWTFIEKLYDIRSDLESFTKFETQEVLDEALELQANDLRLIDTMDLKKTKKGLLRRFLGQRSWAREFNKWHKHMGFDDTDLHWEEWFNAIGIEASRSTKDALDRGRKQVDFELSIAERAELQPACKDLDPAIGIMLVCKSPKHFTGWKKNRFGLITKILASNNTKCNEIRRICSEAKLWSESMDRAYQAQIDQKRVRTYSNIGNGPSSPRVSSKTQELGTIDDAHGRFNMNNSNMLTPRNDIHAHTQVIEQTQSTNGNAPFESLSSTVSQGFEIINGTTRSRFKDSSNMYSIDRCNMDAVLDNSTNVYSTLEHDRCNMDAVLDSSTNVYSTLEHDQGGMDAALDNFSNVHFWSGGNHLSWHSALGSSQSGGNFFHTNVGFGPDNTQCSHSATLLPWDSVTAAQYQSRPIVA